MEKRYPPGRKRGPHPAQTFAELYEKELEEAYSFGFRDEDGVWNDAGVMGVAVLNRFVDQFGDDDEWEVIASEQVFRVKIAEGLRYVGTWDGVWRNIRSKEIILKEWKTTDQFWTSHLALDEQASSYWCYAPAWLKARKILDDAKALKGILYTFLRKAMPDERPTNENGHALNKDGSVSKRQPNPLFHRQLVYRDEHERQMLHARVLAQAREMKRLRSGLDPIYKAPSRFHCMACPFKDPCELHEAGADYKTFLRGAYKTKDQYSAHEIANEGK